MESVKLKFTDDALNAITKEAIKRKTGGKVFVPFWKSVCWMSCMSYDKNNIKECIISEEVILNNKEPMLVYENEVDWA